MVDGVIFQTVDQVAKIWHLDDDASIRVDEFSASGQKVHGVINVGQDIVGDDNPRWTIGIAHVMSGCRIEKLINGCDALVARPFAQYLWPVQYPAF